MDWNLIDSVLLDLDGTLLDLHFDNHFWLEHVPLRYAEQRGMGLAAAKSELLARYKDVEGTMQWYCIDYWSRELGLDIALLKQEVDHLIAVHPHVTDFLEGLCRLGKRIVLVTNAHQKSLALKLEKTRLHGYFDVVICAHDYGTPKEDPGFWSLLHSAEPYDPARTLLVDDNLTVLHSARSYGIRWLLAVLKPDSQAPARTAEGFQAVHDFSEVMPGN